MSALAETTLISHLVDPESLELVAREGLSTDLLPSEELRPILVFSLDYYYRSGCLKAPSVGVLKAEFGEAIDEFEIDLEHEPEDSVEWAMDDLRYTWVHRESSNFLKSMATEMAEAEKTDRVDVVNENATRLVQIGLSLESRAYRAEVADSGQDIIRRYEARAASIGDFRGMGFDLPEVDAASGGIHEGELAVLAAGPKTGKSMYQCWVALGEWKRGRSVSLFTLENSTEMMLDRIACMANYVDTSAWEHGSVTEQELDRVKTWVENMEAQAASGNGAPSLWVLKPDLGQRSFPHMVREAQLRRSQSILIDQLTHVEVGRGDRDHRPRHEKIGEGLHYLKAMISTGRRPLSCLLTHQVNRDGVKYADKAGYLEMWHLAESAEVERTADFIYGLYASRDEQQVGRAKLQMLGARRTPTKHWEITWLPHVGSVRTMKEFQPE